MLDKVTGAAEGEGFKKLLETITSVIAGLEKAIELYNSLPEFGKFLINPAPGLLNLAGTAAQIPSTVSGRGTTVIVNNNIKTAVDPQATARAITKVTNTATKTTGIKPFNFGFR
jgi:hypothetical protein